MSMIDKWENRRNLEYQLKNHFNCTYAYQKLADKQILKSMRGHQWRKSKFYKTIRSEIWNAKYKFKR